MRNKPLPGMLKSSPAKLSSYHKQVKGIRKLGYDINKASGYEMPTMTLEEMQTHDPERAKKIVESGQAGTALSYKSTTKRQKNK